MHFRISALRNARRVMPKAILSTSLEQSLKNWGRGLSGHPPCRLHRRQCAPQPLALDRTHRQPHYLDLLPVVHLWQFSVSSFSPGRPHYSIAPLAPSIFVASSRTPFRHRPSAVHPFAPPRVTFLLASF